MARMRPGAKVPRRWREGPAKMARRCRVKKCMSRIAPWPSVLQRDFTVNRYYP